MFNVQNKGVKGKLDMSISNLYYGITNIKTHGWQLELEADLWCCDVCNVLCIVVWYAVHSLGCSKKNVVWF